MCCKSGSCNGTITCVKYLVSVDLAVGVEGGGRVSLLQSKSSSVRAYMPAARSCATDEIFEFISLCKPLFKHVVT